MLEGVDVIVDGTDNFPTRYLLNDASLRHRIPVVHASIFRFEGQLTVFQPYEGPCYRCLFPQPPPPELAPSCAEGGVLGVLPGIMGSLQASEALKLLLGIGEPPTGRLILFDALDTSFHEVRLRRDPDCPVCGADAGPIEYIDYEEFCLPARAGDDLTWRASACLPSCGRWPAARAPSRPAATACAPRSTTSPSSTPRCARACSTTTARSRPS